MRVALLPVLTGLGLLSACSFIPDYLRPDLPVPDAWPASAPVQAVGPVAADLRWQDMFTPSPLQKLVQRALDNNRDLRVATLNIEAARASYRVAEADELPDLSGRSGATATRTPAGLSQTGRARTSRQYSLGLAVPAYELDLFGRVKSLETQALEQYLASEEAAVSTRIALIAEVVNAALALTSDRQLLALTEETLASRETSAELIRRRFQSGVGSQLDVAQAESAVEAARAAKLRYARSEALDLNALSLLVGAPVKDSDLADVSLAGLGDLASLPAGVPSQVLLSRPDIKAAEHRLKAANANIGAARAAFFPTITLTGTLGLSSPSLDSLFQGSSRSWSFGPSLSVPIFDGGYNQARLDQAKTNREIAVAQYDKAIQTAFREIADALASRATLSDQLVAQQALVAANRRALELSQSRYDRGLDNYLAVLDAQRSLYAAQQEEITLSLSRLSNLVTLYKVLGGGVR